MKKKNTRRKIVQRSDQPTPEFRTLGDAVRLFCRTLGGLDEDELCAWPPDLFAFTSYVLARSGAYRNVVHPAPLEEPTSPESNGDDGYYPPENWGDTTNANARKWLEYLLGTQDGPPEVLQRWREFCRDADGVQFSDFVHNGADRTHPGLWKSIVWFHAVSDAASRAFGIPTGKREDAAILPIRFLANLLVSTTGSLSRLPRHIGTVLPKLRTPQTGISLRSMSHHLAYLETEVSVLWRTVPWLNSVEEGINIVLVPWPPDFQSDRFEPSSAFESLRRQGKKDRYFKYNSELQISPAAIRSLIDKAEEEVDRVHMVVLPELALTSQELRRLETYLAASASDRVSRIPILLTGVRDHDDPSRAGEVTNRVVLSIHFAERWYRLDQDKHHRWRLDKNQLRQYRLGGVLSPSQSWWEALPVGRRRLSFLVPNGWLAISPLICEDLAQLDPTAEVLRGVGPTLVAALLLDGPQLAERWSARYATVLADDPGSSVLTLTSLGMSKRSVPRAHCNPRNGRTVALWKDQHSGLHEIAIVHEGPSADPAADEKTGVVLTASADWNEEFTADSRSDDTSAAVLELHHQSQLTSKSSLVERRGLLEDAAYGPLHVRPADKYDVLELTRFVYLVHLLLIVDKDIRADVMTWITHGPDLSNDLAKRIRPATSILSIVSRNVEASESESKAKRAESGGTFEQEVEYAVWVLGGLLAQADAGAAKDAGRLGAATSDSEDSAHWWSHLARECEQVVATLGTAACDLGAHRISQQSARRTRLLCAHAVLTGISDKLSSRSRVGTMTPSEDRLQAEIMRVLKIPITVSASGDNEPRPTKTRAH